MASPADRLAHLRTRTETMVDALATLVEAESPSTDVGLLEVCGGAISTLGATAIGTAAEIRRSGSQPHLMWRFGDDQRVLLVGHFDTVWPAGTLARWPFTRADGHVTGPGAFDMKGGIVQLFEALATLDDLTGISILLTSDEELGSPSSRTLIEDAASAGGVALVFEPSADGALKTARKGTGMYTLRVAGRAAHAGLEPEKGANALAAAAHVILALDAIGRADLGTTVTPTMARAGTASNVVPAEAVVEVDVRVALPEEAARVDDAIRALAPLVPGTMLTVEGGPNRPPLPVEASRDLFGRAQSCAQQLGLEPLREVHVGGGSDGNFTAAAGMATLDGLGAVGAHAHAEGEYVLVEAMAERAALVAELIAELLRLP